MGAVSLSTPADPPNADTRTVGTFTLTDAGGTANGSHNTVSFTQTVQVQPSNDAPATQPATVSASEDTPYIFQLSDFAFADSSRRAEPGQPCQRPDPVAAGLRAR